MSSNLLEAMEMDEAGVSLEQQQELFRQDLAMIREDIRTGIDPIRFRKAQALKLGLEAASRVLDRVWQESHGR